MPRNVWTTRTLDSGLAMLAVRRRAGTAPGMLPALERGERARRVARMVGEGVVFALVVGAVWAAVVGLGGLVE